MTRVRLNLERANRILTSITKIRIYDNVAKTFYSPTFDFFSKPLVEVDNHKNLCLVSIILDMVTAHTLVEVPTPMVNGCDLTPQM